MSPLLLKLRRTSYDDPPPAAQSGATESGNELPHSKGLGCRYTPERIDIIQKALELRAKGIITF